MRLKEVREVREVNEQQLVDSSQQIVERRQRAENGKLENGEERKALDAKSRRDEIFIEINHSNIKFIPQGLNSYYVELIELNTITPKSLLK